MRNPKGQAPLSIPPQTISNHGSEWIFVPVGNPNGRPRPLLSHHKNNRKLWFWIYFWPGGKSQRAPQTIKTIVSKLFVGPLGDAKGQPRPLQSHHNTSKAIVLKRFSAQRAILRGSRIPSVPQQTIKNQSFEWISSPLGIPKGRAHALRSHQKP